jgi:hypothetical protein
MPTTAGEYTFVGHPRGDKAGKVFVLAHSGEIALKLTRTNARRLAAATRSAASRSRSPVSARRGSSRLE